VVDRLRRWQLVQMLAGGLQPLLEHHAELLALAEGGIEGSLLLEVDAAAREAANDGHEPELPAALTRGRAVAVQRQAGLGPGDAGEFGEQLAVDAAVEVVLQALAQRQPQAVREEFARHVREAA